MLHKIIKTFLTRGISSAGTVMLVYIIGNKLGAESLGTFMLCLSLLIGMSMLSRFGLDLALIKSGGAAYIDKDYGNLKRFLNYSFSLVSLTSISISILLYLALPFLETWLNQAPRIIEVLRLFTLILPIFSFVMLFSIIFKSILRPEISPFFDIGFINFTFSICIFFFVKENTSIYNLSFLYTCLISLFLLLALATLLSLDRKVLLHKHSKENDAKLFYSSLPNMFLPSFMHYIVQWGSLIILGLVATSSEVGQYSISHRISYMVNFILIVLNTVTAPHFSSLYKKGEIKQLEKLAVKSTTYMILFSLPIFFGLLFFSSEILSLAGDEFSNTQYILIILIFGQLINVSTGSVSFLLNMTGHEKEMRNVMLVTGGVAIILCYILSTLYGAIGAAISTSIALILQNTLATWRVHKVLHINTIPLIGRFTKT